MKPMLAMLVMALSSVSCAACGSASKNTSSVSPTSTPTTTTSRTTPQVSRPPQDDNHIQSYGYKASGADKRAITALVKRYYAVAAADDGATACSLLYSPLAQAVPVDYGQSPGPPSLRGKTCAVVMSKLFKHVPGQSAAVLAATEVTGVRLRGKRGFVQLSSKTMPTGEIVVERDGGSWKIGAPIGRACSGCSAG